MAILFRLGGVMGDCLSRPGQNKLALPIKPLCSFPQRFDYLFFTNSGVLEYGVQKTRISNALSTSKQG